MKKNKTRYSFVEIGVVMLFFSLLANCVYAEVPSTTVDSLITKYTHQVKGVTKSEFQHLIDLAYTYSDNMQFEACEQLLTFLFTLTEKDGLRESMIYHVKGYNHARQRKNRQAVDDYLTSAALRREMGQDLLLNYTLTNLGKVYYDLGDYVQALNVYKEALEIAYKINDKTCVALALNGIAIVVSDQKKYEEALQYLREAINNYRLVHDHKSIGRNYFDIGEIKYLMNQRDSALYYFDLATTIGQKENDELVISYSQHRMGTIFLDNQQYEEAEHYFLAGLALREKIAYPLEIALSNLDLAKLYLVTNQYDKAIHHAFTVRDLAQETDFLKGQYKAAELLSELFEKKQDYSKALVYHKEFKRFNDSLFSVDKNQKLEDLNTEIQLEKRTSVLKLHYAKQKNNLLLLSFILGAMALILTIYFLRLKARNKRKFEYQIKEKETEAEKRTLVEVYEERKRISRDVHDDLGSSISSIKMLSEIIFDKTTDPNLKQSHAKLLDMQTEVTEKVRDIVWMLNYENNTLEKLMWYCRSYAENIMESFSISVHTTTADSIPRLKIKDDIRKNLFLCVKEALNNVLKHAKATHVELLFQYQSSVFSIEIIDNGRGFDKTPHKGIKNGLGNMKKRMESIGGQFLISSNSKGTSVIFSIDIPQNRY